MIFIHDVPGTDGNLCQLKVSFVLKLVLSLQTRFSDGAGDSVQATTTQ